MHPTLKAGAKLAAGLAIYLIAVLSAVFLLAQGLRALDGR